jgi:GMP synthase PP-ATPase subunit
VVPPDPHRFDRDADGAAVTAAAIGERLTCVFVNNGVMRKGEPEQVHLRAP